MRPTHHPKPLDAGVARLVDQLDDNRYEALAERAAILEYDARIPRLDAERLALIHPPGGTPLPATLPLARVVDWPLVLPGQEHGLRRIIDAACAAAGVQPQLVAEIDSLSSVKKAVECGIGSTILPAVSVAEEVAAGRLQAVQIDDAGMLRQVMLATSVTRPMTLACRAVMELATELIRQRVASGDWPGRWIGQDGGV